MSPLVSSLQIALIIPKSIQACLFLIAILILNKRYKGVNMGERPLLHKILMVGLMVWFTYIFLDIFIYTIAGLSFESNPSGVISYYEGYDVEHISLLIANILRDIGFIGAIALGWIYLYAALLIKMGERKFEKKILQNHLLSIFVLISIIIIVVNDRIFVKIIGDSITVSAIFNGISGLAIFFTIITYTIGAFVLASIFKTSIRDEKSSNFRNQIIYLIFGMIFMGLGHTYWLVLGSISANIPEILGKLPLLAWYYMGHGLWSASAIFMTFGLKDIKKVPNQEID